MCTLTVACCCMGDGSGTLMWPCMDDAYVAVEWTESRGASRAESVAQCCMLAEHMPADEVVGDEGDESLAGEGAGMAARQLEWQSGHCGTECAPQ